MAPAMLLSSSRLTPPTASTWRGGVFDVVMIIGCSCHTNNLVNYLGTVDHDGDHVDESGAKKAKIFHSDAVDHENDAVNNLNDDDANDDDKEDNDELHLGAVDLLLPTPAAFLWARQVGFHLIIIIIINCHHSTSSSSSA